MNARTRGRTEPVLVFMVESILEQTGSLLASFAEQRPCEGVVYWFGLEQGDSAVVTTLIVPNATSTPGSVRTSALANAEVQSAIVGTPLVLLGQAHTHAAWDVAHSEVDDAETFASFDGALSLVVPYYGRCGVRLQDCALYRHMGGAFRPISHLERESHLRVLPGVRDYRRPFPPDESSGGR